MNVADVMGIISAALEADTALRSAITAQYDADTHLTIFEDVDRDNAPGEGFCPMLQLEPDDRARSSEPTTMGHLIIAGLFVAGAAHALVAGTHIYRTAARARVEALAVPVEKAIIRALDAAAIAHDRVPVEPDKMWVLPESTAFGVFYGFNVRIHDPVY